jgi:small-conductance mechanosensitive channel
MQIQIGIKNIILVLNCANFVSFAYYFVRSTFILCLNYYILNDKKLIFTTKPLKFGSNSYYYTST